MIVLSSLHVITKDANYGFLIKKMFHVKQKRPSGIRAFLKYYKYFNYPMTALSLAVLAYSSEAPANAIFLRIFPISCGLVAMLL